MKLHYIPNILTCLRFLLVGPVILMLLNHQYLFALGLFILAGITDALDGLLARLNGWTSRFGAIADPLADKLLLMSSFVTLCWLHLIPTWLMLVIVARDIWLMLGVISYRYITGRIEVEPTGISKINTFLQILLVPLVLVDLSILPLPTLLINIFMFTVLFTSLASFLHYTWIWGKRAWQTKTLYSSHKILGRKRRPRENAAACLVNHWRHCFFSKRIFTTHCSLTFFICCSSSLFRRSITAFFKTL